MKAMLIPLAMALLGAGFGGGAALALRPAAPEKPDAPHDAAPEATSEPAAEAPEDDGQAKPAPEEAAAHEEAAPEAAKGGKGGDGDAAAATFHQLNSQFVVPVIEGDRTRALVAISISLDLGPGGPEAAADQEPRLRDALLRVMFDHANTGGFSGGYTADHRLEALRAALVERARAILGPSLQDVLITNISRQES